MTDFPPLHGPNRWVGAPDDQDTVRLVRESLPGPEPRGRGWRLPVLLLVALALMSGIAMGHSALNPSTGTSPNAAPAATPLPVAPLPPMAEPAVGPTGPTSTPVPGPAGPRGPAGITKVVYVPMPRSSTSTTSSRPKPKPVDPYAKYAHGSDCGTQTERWSSGHAYASFGHGVYEVPFSCPDWKYGMGTRTSTPNGTVVNPPAK